MGGDLIDCLRAQHAAWSQAQFGNVSAIGPAKHLSKEALEVAKAPDDVFEQADCWMLLWDMQRRAGISDADLAEAIRQKLAINMARKWPEAKESEACEHDRPDGPFVPIPGQSFSCEQDWINRASRVLTGHPQYRNTENSGPTTGWRGDHFTPLCFDQRGRRCKCGADFRIAREDDAYPVWWVWPDQIAPLLMGGVA